MSSSRKKRKKTSPTKQGLNLPTWAWGLITITVLLGLVFGISQFSDGDTPTEQSAATSLPPAENEDEPAAVANDLESPEEDSEETSPTAEPFAGGIEGKIAYSAGPQGRVDIWVLDTFTGEQLQVTRDSFENLMPAWSPDGSQIVYIAPSPVSNQPILFMVDADGQNDPLAILGQSYQHALRPAWSTANNLILFELGGGLLGQLSMAGGQSDPLNAGLPIALTPAVSSDGLVITFAGAESGGTLDIYLLQDSQIIALTSDPAADYQPAWRP